MVYALTCKTYTLNLLIFNFTFSLPSIRSAFLLLCKYPPPHPHPLPLPLPPATNSHMFENKVAVSLARGFCLNWPNPWLKFRIYTALWLPVYLLSWCPELGGERVWVAALGKQENGIQIFWAFQPELLFWICLHTDISSGFSSSRTLLRLFFLFKDFELHLIFYQSLPFVNFYWLSYVCSWPSIHSHDILWPSCHPHNILWPSFHPPWHIYGLLFIPMTYYGLQFIRDS